MNNKYYVYVYIDPRNLEEFYYGKGIGERKNAHLQNNDDSEKTKIIKQIEKIGLTPIIKVVAKNLTQKQAFLVEKTLIWKIRGLTNKSGGHYADNFRPKNTIHLDLNGFDYENGIYYINVGERRNRCWNDCRKYGFLSAGQGKQWSRQIRQLNSGDMIAAYLSKHNNTGGYVGVGKVIEKAKRVNDFQFKGKYLENVKLENNKIFENSDNEKSEYLVKIEWIKSFTAKQGKWRNNPRLFVFPSIKASLESQLGTIKFIEDEFKINFKDLMN
ncbi:GIY-YIG nuclease family protein [Candidatus Parcubacteria bacterium]|nr:GIY-YIG nuclease family protein [Candidatus Parcubacteria bacterium]